MLTPSAAVVPESEKIMPELTVQSRLHAFVVHHGGMKFGGLLWMTTNVCVQQLGFR